MIESVGTMAKHPIPALTVNENKTSQKTNKKYRKFEKGNYLE
jgi:hypothetical protein